MLVVPRLFEQMLSARRDIHELVDDQVSRDVGRHAEKVGALDQRLQADVLWSADLGDGKFRIADVPDCSARGQSGFRQRTVSARPLWVPMAPSRSPGRRRRACRRKSRSWRRRRFGRCPPPSDPRGTRPAHQVWALSIAATKLVFRVGCPSPSTSAWRSPGPQGGKAKIAIASVRFR